MKPGVFLALALLALVAGVASAQWIIPTFGTTGAPPTQGPTQITSIAVSPSTATIQVNQQQTFTATATLSNGAQQDVTNTATWFLGNAPLTTTDTNLTLGTAVTYSEFNNSGHVGNVLQGSTSIWWLDPSPWGVSSGSGSTSISYSGTGSVTSTVNYTGVNNSGVNGYPYIRYGTDQWNDPAVNGQPPQFPVQVSNLQQLITEVNYSLSNTTAPGDQDIGNDEWIIPTSTYNSGNSGALEVFVTWYFNFAYGPAGTFVKNYTEPIVLNGTPTSMTFAEYLSGSGPGAFVLFVPQTNITSGDIRYNLLDFIKEGISTAGGTVSTSWWVSGIEFGTEWGDASSVNYTLTLTKMLISTVTAAGTNIATLSGSTATGTGTGTVTVIASQQLVQGTASLTVASSGPSPNVTPSTTTTLQSQLNSIGANKTAYLACGTYHLATDGGSPGTIATNYLNPPAGQTIIGCNVNGTCPAVPAQVPSAPPCVILDGAVTVTFPNTGTINGVTEWWTNPLPAAYALSTPTNSGQSDCVDTQQGGASNVCQYSQDLFMTPNAYVSGGNVTDITKTVVVNRTLSATPNATSTGGCHWFYDFNNTNGKGSNVIFLACDPTNYLVELTVAQNAFRLSNGGVTVQNVSAYGFSTALQDEMFGTYSGNNTIAEVWATHGHGSGIGCTGGLNNQFLYNEVAEMGQMGIHDGGTCGSSTFRGNRVERNNEDNVAYGFEAGGSKFAATAGDVIDSNTFSCNNGNGLWTDSGQYNGTIINNTVNNNLINGLVVEISHNDTIQNNTITQNNQGNACQCIAAHVPVLYNPTQTTAHDVCTGPQTMGGTQYTSCSGSKADLWLHESWNMTVGGASGKGNRVESKCSGVTLGNTNSRDNLTGNTITYNTFILHNSAGLAYNYGGSGDTSAYDFYNDNNLWDYNSYTCDAAGKNNWTWGSGSTNCTGYQDTQANWSRWQGVCGNDVHGSQTGC